MPLCDPRLLIRLMLGTTILPSHVQWHVSCHGRDQTCCYRRHDGDERMTTPNFPTGISRRNGRERASATPHMAAGPCTSRRCCSALEHAGRSAAGDYSAGRRALPRAGDLRSDRGRCRSGDQLRLRPVAEQPIRHAREPDCRTTRMSTTFATPLLLNMANGQDQLRQRMIFALSQIIVVSANKNGSGNELAPWVRLLSRNAFGNYRTLLREVTLSPTMGKYLDNWLQPLHAQHRRRVPTARRRRCPTRTTLASCCSCSRSACGSSTRTAPCG